MTDFKGIPVSSGSVFERDGVRTIKDGVKRRGDGQQAPRARKPQWLKARAPGGEGYRRVRGIVHDHHLSTVCEESHCPNLGECWSHGTATFMVLGSVCTRTCRFCSVDTGNPKGRLDDREPQHCAESVRLMGLRYVVLTSVDRDDLRDGGAEHYAQCVRAIKAENPETAVEALTPDFRGDEEAVRTVVESGLEVFAHNVEVVRRLSPQVRDPRADYEQSLDVLRAAKRLRPDVVTKSSLMVGLGETDAELHEAFEDLRRAEVDIVTLGQYLQPTRNHLPVERFVSPDEFEALRQEGLRLGFREVVAGPLVRSSYRADRVLEGNNVGLPAPGPDAG
ncbi:MAG: lipoyl synthase [Halorhodospira halophila]|uniref:lipoyl synthase n=1 Tax=Halorhodospira TaxID=85108 RepID=UPI00191219FC|nr:MULTISPECIES: lipoyl synthase [Halorhodospira]MBK5942446.1 lipoyl synthase [Halorhodospira halophila]MCC3750652.1 lipoyl synthase [Halorhodospira halophila]MCG5528227.1 lipoyl synthase [Halorhodospira halophila]MCG5531996.1 lipoyl synthase [Halorhodospira sp. 9621]MCG5538346.1 lipoyl synthase [Halorhodospira sp. 9622]